MSEHGHDPEKRKMSTSLSQPEVQQPRALEEKADWIGRELRKVFDETVNEPIPDRLQALLSRLEDEEGEGQAS